ncbi:MAG: bifunctional oligoribonuclease/PAP phosphatase NrnA [Chloroflexi bacterium]|jgi:bifunctional oligoribonuclease and PAP phosphatase NrnA|nr:bifunctional oligoribonuclease/PAP phosphatase NrnA [Chloroflexota bacterium]MBT4304405.1 bifunctional oligoribonuclease/PAP phosphatase NrnA [Chloroflexota bacterium]MBT4754996.1 bifunctional oligoribonuclease/PAP phosphatase NrnA [Chloroflexota bacterium]MBT5336260.1 bifunctional oligoribonuclease/PAP phosphatase NrnA [Chloroflexota bacterium]MBT6152735.1 bifunctional oligoribonuclease/PAP phosphatase NrnA [Chloroflexota bacterium]
MSQAILTEIKQRLEQSNNILITSHIRPDGDAVGSVIAVGLALQELGKKVQMVLNDGVPASFRFLEGADQVTKYPKQEFDMVFVVDCGDLNRVGNVVDYIKTIDVNIDHHPTNPKFGELNLVQSDAVSTTEILIEHFPELGFPFTPGVVDALMTGLVTDTQGFKTSNVHAGALRRAADMIEKGADLPDLTYRVLTRKSFEAVSYWAAGLSLIEREGPFVWASLTYQDRKKANYNGRDDADLVNFLSRIEGANVALVFIEQTDNEVKISWRAKNGYDVSKIAQVFGGGGHVAAAGATVEGNLPEVRDKVLKITKETILDNKN